MFNKEGLPFFIITIPFICIVFLAVFSLSYYIKLSNESLNSELSHYKTIYVKNQQDKSTLKEIENFRKELIKKENKKYTNFILVITGCILFFMIFFTILMVKIVNDIIKKYIKKVEHEEKKLQDLNATLISKVERGIEKGKRKDKAILEQSKLARLGSMLSMIAHQWRQPLSELSGVLMELETATRFKKVNHEHILKSIERSDGMIEFMSNTIDDFRNFYKPDKVKENFFVVDSCQKAINLIDASLKNSDINFTLHVKDNVQIYGYPTEYSQVILNILSNAKDILSEKEIKNPKIILNIEFIDGQSVVSIKDNAGGIKEEYMDQLFDPYFSTKSSGTGLGLYISKLIIEKNMRGELLVENDHEGAVFKIILKVNN